MQSRITLIGVGIVSLVLGACTNDSVPRAWQRSAPIGAGDRPAGLSGAPSVEAPAPAAAATVDPRNLTIYDTYTQQLIGWYDLVGDASKSDIVLIGEMHGHAQSQRLLPALLEDIAVQAPEVWLSLEFFERDQQTALDDYLVGVTTEEEFKSAARRDAENYPAGHREMVNVAKRLGRPVIASNAPRRYVRLARTAGFERLQTLGPEQQALFVVPETLTEGEYRSKFESQMREMIGQGHNARTEAKEKAEAAKVGDTTAEPSDAEAKVAGYYRAQNVWDATMADSIARTALAGGRPVVHIVGQFHADHAGGLTERIRALAPNLHVMTISLVDGRPGANGSLREEDKGRADVVVYVGR